MTVTADDGMWIWCDRCHTLTTHLVEDTLTGPACRCDQCQRTRDIPPPGGNPR